VDRDALTLGRIYNENPADSFVVGVDFKRRVIRGIQRTIPGAAKVIFAADGRIQRFANGPVGVPLEEQARLCSP
jgi:hypothetical protein